MPRPLILALVMLMLATPAVAQRGRRGGGGGAGGRTVVSPRPLKGVVITQRGVLKQLSKKTILLLADDSKLVTIKRSSKTKFFEGDKEIKAYDVTLDSIVNIDVTEDDDLKLLALVLKVEKAVAKQGGVLIRR